MDVHADTIWESLDLEPEKRKILAHKVINTLETIVDESEEAAERRQAATVLSEILGLRRRDNRMTVTQPLVVNLPNYEDDNGRNEPIQTGSSNGEQEQAGAIGVRGGVCDQVSQNEGS